MRLVFLDGSFLEVFPNQNEDKLNFIMCGFKNPTELTMSSSELEQEQVQELNQFLSNWLKNKQSALNSEIAGV